jgi:hypothetical protein
MHKTKLGAKRQFTLTPHWLWLAKTGKALALGSSDAQLTT